MLIVNKYDRGLRKRVFFKSGTSVKQLEQNNYRLYNTIQKTLTSEPTGEIKMQSTNNRFDPSILILFLSIFILMPFSTSNAQESTPPEPCTLLEGRIKVDTLRQEAINSLSKEDLQWYQKFNEGIFFFDGWKEITETVLEKYTPEEKEDIILFMQHLGIRIGAEWSRDNDVRKINTDMLRAWGKKIRGAAKAEKAKLTIALHELDSEVLTILQSDNSFIQNSNN
jgi:hypothetical protein